MNRLTCGQGSPIVRLVKWYEPPNAALVGTEVPVFHCPSNRSRGVRKIPHQAPNIVDDHTRGRLIQL